MNREWILRAACASLLAATLASVPPALADDDDDDQLSFGDGNGVEGAVFVMTNSTDTSRGNEIVMFNRKADGALDFFASYATGGLGSGPAPTASVFGSPVQATADGLGSQENLILGTRSGGDDDDDDGDADGQRRQVFAVNAGSNSVTCFVVTRDGLTSRRTADSGGVFPVSLTFNNGILYVLNAGGAGSIRGFRVGDDCTMRELRRSTRSLAGVFAIIDPPFPSPEPNEVLTTPAQISFTPNGRQLVVSIKGGPPSFGGGVAVFRVSSSGRLAPSRPAVTTFTAEENLAGPFGFTFDRRGNLLLNHGVSFTFASHKVESSGALTLISGPLPIGALADGSILQFGAFNCWVVRFGDIAYVMSFGDIPASSGGLPDGPGIISAVEISDNGELSLLAVDNLGATGVVAVLAQDDRDLFPAEGSVFGNHGIELATVEGSQGNFLYTVEPRVGRIGQWEIDDDGTLIDLGSTGGLAEGVDPFVGTNPGIDDFQERCFNQAEGSRDPECALGSAQGIVGF